ncbi:hypothetical protein K437DRAFT_241811 [Tilletiaria anomala UBC 951]|uniref:SUR7-domain-containing protein n=1 Tax=Tilletiaria anomala (strain ATCC 24038 / CBS 436.72 / UBC 951) TaxID=1037660 RepID=A0A066WRH6_TILAU|nr:uncharacterized protein K437DRAFT_241811 [Tilletiaria anomala UBC 951]KDN53604.1 hypothetical protein K437DRAFT_241811 [Tilletiaria anomala UBC 951]
MARGFCVGLGEFLTFAAMVLAILVNIGQISQNTVARHFYLVSADLTGLQNSLTTNAAATNVQAHDIYATDQASPLLQNNGLRQYYYWGMYSVCGGEGVGGARSCSPNEFVHRFEPLDVLEADQSKNSGFNISTVLPSGTIQDNAYLGKFSNGASIILLAGTIAAGLAFLVSFLAHHFAFLISALLALLAAVCLAVAAAIWTALVAKVRSSLTSVNIGLVVHYGQSIWLTWGAAGACLLAFVPLVLSCCTARSKY